MVDPVDLYSKDIEALLANKSIIDTFLMIWTSDVPKYRCGSANLGHPLPAQYGHSQSEKKLGLRGFEISKNVKNIFWVQNQHQLKSPLSDLTS